MHTKKNIYSAKIKVKLNKSQVLNCYTSFRLTLILALHLHRNNLENVNYYITLSISTKSLGDNCLLDIGG